MSSFSIWTISACNHTPEGESVVRPADSALADSAFADLIRPLLALAQKHPEKADSHGELGLVYEANELWPEAIASFEKAARIDSASGIWELHSALVYRQSGEMDQARALLERLALRFPSSVAVWHHLGVVFLESGSPIEAEEAFRRVVEKAPSRPHGYIGVADALLQQGKPEQAEVAAQRGLERDPGFLMGHYVLGTAYQRLGRLDDAELELKRGADAVYEFLPDPMTHRVQRYTLNPSKLSLIAHRYFNDGAVEEATRLLEHAHRYQPNSSILLNNLAIVYMGQNRLDEAAGLLVRAGNQADPSLETYINLAYFLSMTGQADSARSCAEKAVALAPESHAAHLALAQAYMDLGAYGKAYDAAQKAHELGAYDAQTFGLLGDLSFREGNMEDACDHFESALAITPTLLPAWTRLAEARATLGDFAGARAAVEQARKIDSSHPLLRRVEQQLGLSL